MSLSFVFVQTANLRLPPAFEQAMAAGTSIRVLDCSQNLEPLWSFMQSPEAAEIRCLGLSAELLSDAQFMAYLETEPRIDRAVWIYDRADSFAKIAQSLTSVEKQKVFSSMPADAFDRPSIFTALLAALDPARPLGVKSFLQEGSSIYTQSFIGLNALGASLDPLSNLANPFVGVQRGVRIWSGVNAIVAEAIAELPMNLSTGARVELQVGADAEKLCASVRFPAQHNLASLTLRFFDLDSSSLSSWSLLRDSADFIEGRFYEELKQIELNAVWFKEAVALAKARPLLIRSVPQVPLDDAAKTAAYRFLSFTSIASGKKRGVQFRKQASATLAAQENAALANVESPDANATGASPNVDRAAPLDPTQHNNKLNAITGIIDRQKEALTQNVQRLEAELAEAAKREKELMGMVDRAIQQKDKLQRDYKALELRLETATSPNNSLVVKLQKQLDEANRQKSLLSKRLAELVQAKKSA